MKRVQSAPEDFHYKSSNKIPNGSLYSPGHLPCSTRNEAGAIDDTVAAEKEVQLQDVQPPVFQPQVVQHQDEDCVFEMNSVETEKVITHDVKSYTETAIDKSVDQAVENFNLEYAETSSEEPHKEDRTSGKNEEVSTHIPAEGPVNIRSFDEESWLLGIIETENDPYWFENKCFRKLCTMAGGEVLKKFIAKFKEIKNAERTKDHSSTEEEEKKYGLTSP